MHGLSQLASAWRQSVLLRIRRWRSNFHLQQPCQHPESDARPYRGRLMGQLIGTLQSLAWLRRSVKDLRRQRAFRFLDRRSLWIRHPARPDAPGRDPLGKPATHCHPRVLEGILPAGSQCRWNGGCLPKTKQSHEVGALSPPTSWASYRWYEEPSATGRRTERIAEEVDGILPDRPQPLTGGREAHR